MLLSQSSVGGYLLDYGQLISVILLKKITLHQHLLISRSPLVRVRVPQAFALYMIKLAGPISIIQEL